MIDGGIASLTNGTVAIERDRSYKTTCSYCGVGCGIVVKKDRKNNIRVEGDKDHPANKGMLCSKGMNLHYAMQDTRRPAVIS